MKQRNMPKGLTIFVFLLCLLGATRMGSAQTVNEEGKFTSVAWQDQYYYIKFNNIEYMFMPEIQVDAKFTGYQLQKPTPELLRHFKAGDKAIIAKQGFRIYRVQFLNK